MSSTVLANLPDSSSSSSTSNDRAPISGTQKRNVPAQGWIDQGAAASTSDASSALTSFTILLQQQNRDKLEQLLKEVSDPKSAKYGQYLTPQQINELTNPPAEQQQSVIDWLSSSFHLSTSDQIAAHIDARVGDAIKVINVTVADVEKAFQCTMHAFEEKNPEDPSGVAGITRPLPPLTTVGPAKQKFVPRHIYRCSLDTSPSIPATLSNIITGSVGLSDFPTRFHAGPRPIPVPVGPNPHIDPVRTVPVAGEVQTTNVIKQDNNPGIHANNVVSIKGKSSEQQSQAEKSESSSQQPHGGQHETPTSIPFKPHQTFRTKEQLQHLAQQLDREQLRK